LKIDCFKIDNDLQLVQCDYKSTIDNLKELTSSIWIDIVGFDNEHLNNELGNIDLNGLAKKLCLEARNRQGFYPMNKLTFLVLPVLASSGDYHEVEHIAFLIRENYLLTLRDTKATRLQSTITTNDSNEWLPENSVQGLVNALMLVLSLESLQRTSNLRDSIMVLEKKMDTDPESVSMNEISHKRTELLTFESVISGQMPVIEAYIEFGKEQDNLGINQKYLLSAKANLQATNNSLDWLEGRIDVMRSIYDLRSQEKTNRRLGRLTIVSAIFLPLTFLSAIWGMNFQNMPLLNLPFGFPIALASMFLIAIGIYQYFKKNHWLE